MISDEGMPIFGTGSEWFWTAMSTLIVLISLVAIYRQIKGQTASSAIAQMFAFEEELDGERILRHKLAIVKALHAGVSPEQLPEAPAFAISTFFSRVGFLTRREHFDRDLLWVSRPYADWWWQALSAWVRQRRLEESDPGLFSDFEWLAHNLGHPRGETGSLSVWDPSQGQPGLERRISWYQDQIDVAVQLRH
jgi:hypothetical protein